MSQALFSTPNSQAPGASAGVFEKRLPDGLTVRYSGLPQHHIDGRDYQYVGLEPDVLVPFHRAALYRDGVDAVRAWWIRSSNLAVERAAELASRDRVRPAMPAAP